MPQDGQVVFWSDGEDAEGMRVKLVARCSVRIDGVTSTSNDEQLRCRPLPAARYSPRATYALTDPERATANTSGLSMLPTRICPYASSTKRAASRGKRAAAQFSCS